MKRATSNAEILLAISRQAGRPLRSQLEHELRCAIRSGRLPVGCLLPATRVLASDLRVSRGIVIEAYEQLLAEGYLTARHGSGTRVAARLAEFEIPLARADAKSTIRHDFRPGIPDLAQFPRRAWLSAMRRALDAASDAMLDYPDARGIESARCALAAYLNRARATMAQPENVIICNGSAQAIYLLCRILSRRKIRRIAVENPGYAEQCTDIRATGMETCPVTVDEDGICVERLASMDVGAVLVTPAHQYPTGAVLSPQRRTALLEWARRSGALIVEDDYDAEYRYDREPLGALQGLAPDVVCYVGTASKTLSPALRLGWLLLPAKVSREVAQAKLQMDRGSPVLDQLALADFISRGELDRHLRRTRLVYKRRRDRLVKALRKHLPNGRQHGVAAGLHLFLELPGGARESEIVKAAARHSIRVFGASAYRIGASRQRPALVVGYGAVLEHELERGVQQLARVINCRDETIT